MSDAEKKPKSTEDLAYPERFSQLQQWFTEKRASRTGFRGIDKNIGQIERQLYSTEIKTSYNASQRFCFASVISLNDLNYLRVIEVRSFKHAIRIPESNHCLNLRSIFHVEFVTEKTLSGQLAKQNL